MTSHNFIEILLGMPDLHYLRTENVNGYIFQVFESSNTKINPIFIDVSSDEIPDGTGKGYLMQLGVPELIPSLFPTTEEKQAEWDVMEELAKIQKGESNDLS